MSGLLGIVRRAALALALLSTAVGAGAQVDVQVVGNQALAQIALPAVSPTVFADVTITFDTPTNLTATELNLSAELVDPSDSALLARLPQCLVACVSIDPAFPLLITVEPLEVPWIFQNGFEQGDDDPGLLAFLNTYEFEIHTANLDCIGPVAGAPCPATPYRLFKAPLAGNFVDYTEEILKGSVRARGRDGAFSQFLIVADTRPTVEVELDKALRLETRIVAATLTDALRTQLLGDLATVQVAAVVNLDYAAAITDLDSLIALVQANAGAAIANRWSADHSVVNDAGEIEGLAGTLRYTLARLQAGG